MKEWLGADGSSHDDDALERLQFSRDFRSLDSVVIARAPTGPQPPLSLLHNLESSLNRVGFPANQFSSFDWELEHDSKGSTPKHI